MEKEQFDKTKFNCKMEIVYKQRVYFLRAVNFEERLIAYSFNNDPENTLCWIRCESCEIIV